MTNDMLIEAQVSSPILHIIQTRRSLRRYLAQAVPESYVDQLLEAGRWSPSAHNRQPWRFVVIQSQATKEHLATTMGTRLRHDLEADCVPEAIIEKDVNRSYERITSAPLLIVVCLSMVDMDVYSDDKRNENEFLMAVQSVAMAGQNILLTAHSLGLGACWMCAPLFCPETVQLALDLPEDWQAQGIITAGYPAQEREKTREPIETKVLWR